MEVEVLRFGFMKHILIKSRYCLLISIMGFAAGTSAEAADQQYRYAEQLFESGDYQAARLAYKRLLFYDTNAEFRDIADYRIAQSYYYQSETTRAEALFRDFSTEHPNSPLRFQSQLMLGQLHFDAGAYSLARTTLFELLHTTNDPEVVAAAHYLRGWCYIHTTDWNKAISELRQADISQDVGHPGKKARELADILLEETPLSTKSPQVAGWLSTVVPGSGQLYAGKIREGFLAAALNGTFIYLAVDAIRERRYVDCVGISLIGWRFYWGNRTDARRFATEYNAHREQALIETLNRQTDVSVP